MIDDALLDEVTALVEWPVPLAGRFEERFLDAAARGADLDAAGSPALLPGARGADGKLLPLVHHRSNIESRDPAQVRAGNERVVRPRLSDAAFFWDQDRKQPLASHCAALKRVTFQAQLGSLRQGAARRAARARDRRAIGGDRGARATRAAQLAKCDLLTAMVGEFPELQGIMGRYYAQPTASRPRSRGDPGALPAARRRRCAARDAHRHRRRARRQARHAGRHLRDRPEAHRHEGSVRAAPRRARRAAHRRRAQARPRPARADRPQALAAAAVSQSPDERRATRCTTTSSSACAPSTWRARPGCPRHHRDVRRRARHAPGLAARFRRAPARAGRLPAAAGGGEPRRGQQAHRQHPAQGDGADPAERSTPRLLRDPAEQLLASRSLPSRAIVEPSSPAREYADALQRSPRCARRRRVLRLRDGHGRRPGAARNRLALLRRLRAVPARRGSVAPARLADHAGVRSLIFTR